MTHICPDCKNQFIQPFVCTTCGAKKLYDAELNTAFEQVRVLREILDEAVNTDGGVSYDGEDDEVGTRACCYVTSYKPHDPNCWVSKAKKILQSF